MQGDYGVSEESGAAAAPEAESDENSFLAPKDAFGGECKEGDTYTVKVVGVYEDELELAKVDKESKPADMDSTPDSRMDEMAGGA